MVKLHLTEHSPFRAKWRTRHSAILQNRRITKRLEKQCACCPRKMRVILYSDRSYRGGHYFGKIPLHTNRELRRALKAGTHTARLGNHTLNVLNCDLKLYKYEEYWECPKCYWFDTTRPHRPLP